MSELPASLSFETTFAEIPVTYGDEEYVLVEGSESVTRAFKKESAKRTHMRDGSVHSVEDPGYLERYLVSLCLVTKDERSPVPMNVLSTWRSKVVHELFSVAHKLCGLEALVEDDDDEGYGEEDEDGELPGN